MTNAHNVAPGQMKWCWRAGLRGSQAWLHGRRGRKFFLGGRRQQEPGKTLAALLSVVCAAAAAAGQTPKNLADATLEELSNIKVYSASKYEQSVSQAPASVTIITHDEIEKYGYRTLADILRSVRGFFVTYDRNYSYLGVRGFDRPGDYNPRILLLVDGHRLNNNIYDQAMLGTEFPVDVDLIDRVEVVRGPSSSLYGSSAFFAVINVISRKPPQLSGWEVSFEPASFDTYKGIASFGGQFKGAQLLLSGTFYDSQGQTLFFPEFNTPATNYGFARRADDDVYQHFLSTLSFRGFTLQGVFSSREKGVPTAYYGTVFSDSRTHNIDDHQYFDLSYQHSLGEAWSLAARTSYDQYRLEAPLAVPSGMQDGGVVVNKVSAQGNWWDGELRLSRTLLGKHKLTFGSEMRDNLRQDQGNYDASHNSFQSSQHNSWNWAAYAEDEFAVARKLTLSAGLRYDRYSTFGGTTNPRFALIHHPFARTTLKLLYGTAFRAPSVFEMYSGETGIMENNPGLVPETIRSVEGIVEQGLGQHFSLSGNVFRNQIGELISQQPDSSTGLLVFSNSRKAQATGAEIEFAGRFPNGFQGAVSYSLVDADDNTADDLKLVNSPRQMLKLNLIAPLFRKRMFAGLDAQYTSARLTLAGNHVTAFTVLNATLLAHTFGRRLDFSASIYNLLDRKYFDPVPADYPQDAIQQDGRSFRLKLTWKFRE